MRKDTFAPTAPMGWNSYDYYDTTVNEAQVKANADYMAEHLKPFGWEYIVVDIEWYSADAGTQRKEYQYIPFGDNAMDAYGRLQPAANRFPSAADGRGFTSLAAYVHSLGLKFGIHIMRGIAREAAHKRLPIFGSDLTCDLAADAYSICPWNPDMYGVKDNEAGQKYYDSLIQMYADWGVDFIKCDDICDSKIYPVNFSGWHETEMIAKAIEKCGREIVLSLSPGPAHLDRAFQYAKNANMWRITDDFWDQWEPLKSMFWRCETWQDHVKPGCYPDCDMLPLGKLFAGFEAPRHTYFTDTEIETMMSLWCMFGSPLMIGAELTKLTKEELRFLTNERLLSMIRESRKGHQIRRTDEDAVWVNTKAGERNVFVGLFNLSEEERIVSVSRKELDIVVGRTATELWSGASVSVEGDVIAMKVPAHGAKVLEIV